MPKKTKVEKASASAGADGVMGLSAASTSALVSKLLKAENWGVADVALISAASGKRCEAEDSGELLWGLLREGRLPAKSIPKLLPIFRRGAGSTTAADLLMLVSTPAEMAAPDSEQLIPGWSDDIDALAMWGYSLDPEAFERASKTFIKSTRRGFDLVRARFGRLLEGPSEDLLEQLASTALGNKWPRGVVLWKGGELVRVELNSDEAFDDVTVALSGDRARWCRASVPALLADLPVPEEEEGNFKGYGARSTLFAFIDACAAAGPRELASVLRMPTFVSVDEAELTLAMGHRLKWSPEKLLELAAQLPEGEDLDSVRGKLALCALVAAKRSAQKLDPAADRLLRWVILPGEDAGRPGLATTAKNLVIEALRELGPARARAIAEAALEERGIYSAPLVAAHPSPALLARVMELYLARLQNLATATHHVRNDLQFLGEALLPSLGAEHARRIAEGREPLAIDAVWATIVGLLVSIVNRGGVPPPDYDRFLHARGKVDHGFQWEMDGLGREIAQILPKLPEGRAAAIRTARA
jgi:hypothetical protein